MPFDSFFRELETTNHGKERILCYCRHPKVGQLKLQADESYQFDCSRSTSRSLQVLTKISPKKRREWETRPTLDDFFEKDYISRVSKRDIPSPPPPHKVDNPTDS